MNLAHIRYLLEEDLPMVIIDTISTLTEPVEDGESTTTFKLTVSPVDIKFFCSCGYVTDITKYVLRAIKKNNILDYGTWKVTVNLK